MKSLYQSWIQQENFLSPEKVKIASYGDSNQKFYIRDCPISKYSYSMLLNCHETETIAHK